MSTTTDLRSRVLEQVGYADDKLLRMIQALAESYHYEEEEIMLTDAQKNELDKRIERHQRGETRFYSWEEVKQKLKKAE